MSGGHFEYQQYRLGDIAESIKEDISNNDKNEYYNYSKETIQEFEKAVYYLEKAQIYAQRIDWLCSGDDSEETFHERLKSELIELEEKHFVFPHDLDKL